MARTFVVESGELVIAEEFKRGAIALDQDGDAWIKPEWDEPWRRATQAECDAYHENPIAAQYRKTI